MRVLALCLIAPLAASAAAQTPRPAARPAPRSAATSATAPVSDVHGGWYDATGDYGIHLSHQNPTSYFNPQQAPLVAWSLLSSYDLLKGRNNDNFSWLCDLKRWNAWTFPLRSAGSNTLLTYLLPDLWYFLLVSAGITFFDFHWNVGAPGVIKSLVFTAFILALSELLTRSKVRLQL